MAEPASICRLYLTVPLEAATGGSDCQIARISQGGDVACVLFELRETVLDDEALGGVADCIATLQALGIAVLLGNDTRLAQRLGCDGVHLTGQPDPVAACENARERLGGDCIVGAHAGRSRHEAMVMGEAGADYIAFGPVAADEILSDGTDRELIAWWADLFEVPCVAWYVTEPEVARAFAAVGADFVAIPCETLGRDADAATERLRTFSNAVDGPPHGS